MENASKSNQPTGARPVAVNIGGASVYAGYLNVAEQAALLGDLRAVVAAAPLFSPLTPHGKPMRVRMTSAGRLGWISDRSGYRYAGRHPSGVPWPDIPDRIVDIWREVGDRVRLPDCCLVNYYGDGAGMGLHQDRDEADFAWPVVSISLGDDALFRIGGNRRGGRTQSLWLRSGDVVVLGGEARLAYHGIDRIAFGTSPLLRDGGRINLTLRVVT